jgi:hypothetical protein
VNKSHAIKAFSWAVIYLKHKTGVKNPSSLQAVTTMFAKDHKHMELRTSNLLTHCTTYKGTGIM